MKFAQLKSTLPGPPTSQNIRPTRGPSPASRVSYYNAKYGAVLWEQLAEWQKDNYPRKSWSWYETGDTESTLKAKLYNTLKFLKDFGTPNQKELCEKVTFKRLEREYVLAFKRVGLDTFSRSRNANAPTPAEQTSSARGGAAFDEIRRDVVRFVTEREYNAVDNTYPVYEKLSVFLSDAQKEELEYITGANPNCLAFISAGTKGVIRLTMVGDEELAKLNRLNNPVKPEEEAKI